MVDEEVGEDDEDDEALVLHVIEIHSGNILQTMPLEVSGRDISSIIVDGDEIYIADFKANKVIALRFAGLRREGRSEGLLVAEVVAEA